MAITPWLRLLLLLPAAACATSGEREAEALRHALESSQASLAALAPQGIPAQPAPRPVSLTAATSPAAMPALPAAASGPAPTAAAQLLGAPPALLRRWLGEPSLIRAEGGAEVWLYAGPACALDLVLYPAGDGLGVAHAAARASGATPRTEAACLAELAGRPMP
ncbi:hypothetical protein [Roseicella frigidaeris]|uniref:Toxin co-regulated pilus biosynthesis protein Q C-terminal domain-containing protein n=1 Tax=Roseicella frigidaeris TaxID=2230885 RepID=A0A327MKU2_9PROT|nr:hypothetical protein [Roseicella frigidaeris]RAI60778.1 hypothetical protein DOO78_01215 [Roseicella frigidaeris]